MARKLSNQQRESLKSEEGARVITKKRVVAVPEAANDKEDVVPRGAIDIAPVQAAIEESGAKVVEAIQSIDMPEFNAPDVIVESKPMIKKIHVENIERNGQNRIESADFTFTYQELH